jgi:hypothetical protein
MNSTISVAKLLALMLTILGFGLISKDSDNLIL